eukprot:TRINITY_DN21064_c0_g2_i2.p1 TRINITY_DN21064_c0_g2~~TRINITY_DN21064_c0_g2_i2.p1  ORF type:complete len:440 (-),score=95.51 TRINITY_DN21064_c0_g2_i2:111-1430(-)
MAKADGAAEAWQPAAAAAASPAPAPDIEAAAAAEKAAVLSSSSKAQGYGTTGADAGGANFKGSSNYNMQTLKTWSVFLSIAGTVFDNKGLWRTLSRLLTLTLVVAIFGYAALPDPLLLDVTKFAGITAVLSLFVSLMLSFFLSCSVSRWLHCTEGFEDVFVNVRVLALELMSLGVARPKVETVVRYAIVAVHFLVCDLEHHGDSPEDRKMAVDRLCQSLLSKDGHGSLEKSSSRLVCLFPEELELLRDEPGDLSNLLWAWISSLLARLATDGEIPSVATPTYNKVMGIAQAALKGMRQVRNSVLVQMPYVYLHLLAVLVHINSMCLAINFGLSLGVIFHSITLYVHHYYGSHEPPANGIVPEPLTTQIQSLIVESFKGVMGPLLYQAFFDIGISISSPFRESQAAIPVSRLMDGFDVEFRGTARLFESPPFWKRAIYKQ